MNDFQWGMPQNPVTAAFRPTNDFMGFLEGMGTGPGPAAPASTGINWLNQYGANGQMTGQGVLAPALGVAQGLLGGYLGLKQYGLAKQQLAEGRRQFEMNFDAQRRLTNASLADRQRARLSADPMGKASYDSVADYMAKYGVQGG